MPLEQHSGHARVGGVCSLEVNGMARRETGERGRVSRHGYDAAPAAPNASATPRPRPRLAPTTMVVLLPTRSSHSSLFVARWLWSGPPTGRDFQITNADFCRFTADDTIAEQWGILDMIGLLRHLGLRRRSRQNVNTW